MQDQNKDTAALKRALFALKDMRAKLEAIERDRSEPIAVIGLACRFPGANGPEAFWNLLVNGVDAIGEVPADRWDINAFYDPNPGTPGKMHTRNGGFISGVDQFDAQFFGIAPREAIHMDPQQRLLLEVSWEALEHAGLAPERIAGTAAGVFVGVGSNDYAQLQLEAGDPSAIDAYFSTGNASSAAAGRISYTLGLQGPSMVVDTACSSALTAVHLACQSLRQREISLALAGGVNLILAPSGSIALSKIGMLAPDGRCKTFDARADGFGRGEGCGVVVLKRLSDALADNDQILALIRGSAANQDGRSAGMTAPNGPAQQMVIRTALAQAGVAPHEVGYVESHGTGTSLGDPIELQALGDVLRENRDPARPVLVGSVKTNIGHLEAAAGIAGLIKVVLSLQHRQIPPHLHLQERNPYIPWSSLPIEIPTSLQAWTPGYERYIAGVSSFGASGTNVHIVLEAAPECTPVASEQTSKHHILPLSAQSPEALHKLARWYRDWLATPATSSAHTLHDICYTASLRRGHHEYRLAALGMDHAELADQLDAFVRDEARQHVVVGQAIPGRRRKLAFVFSGQGAQWIGMGRELLAHEPVFQELIQRCDTLLRNYADWSLLEELRRAADESRLHHTHIAQPALFSIQIGIVALLQSCGIEPAAVVGHSIGEVAAAYVAGALTLEDAVRLVYFRGQLMEASRGQGEMASLDLPPSELAPLLLGYEQQVSVAAINSPSSTVIAGDPAAIAAIVERAQQQGIFCRPLQVNYAFHSPQMAPFQPLMVERLKTLLPHIPSIPFYSTVTGQQHSGSDLHAEYWGRNIVAPVQFAKAINALVQDGYDFFLEIGPHPVLRHALHQCLSQSSRQTTVLATLRRDTDAQQAMLAVFAGIYAHGYPVDWSQWYSQGGNLVPVTTYPWQHQRFWVERSSGQAQQQRPRMRGQHEHPLLGAPLELAHDPRTKVWESEFDANTQPYLYAYQHNKQPILPLAAIIDCALELSAQQHHGVPRAVSNLVIKRPLLLEVDATTATQVTLTSTGNTTSRMGLYSRKAGRQWQAHATAQLTAVDPAPPETLDLAAIRAHCAMPLESSALYDSVAADGLHYDSRLRVLGELWLGKAEALAHVPATHGLARHQQAVRLLEACVQTAMLAASSGDSPTALVPHAVAEIVVESWPTSDLLCYARAFPGDNGQLRCDTMLLSENGEVVLRLRGVQLEPLVSAQTHILSDPLKDWLYQVEWRAQPRNPDQTRPGADAWVIFADAGGVGLQLAQHLAAQHRPYMLVKPHHSFAQLAENDYQIRPHHSDDLVVLLRDIHNRGWANINVLHLWALDARTHDDTPAATLLETQVAQAAHIVQLVQGLARESWATWPTLWVATRGSQAVEQGDGINPVQASLWGLGRVIAVEHPELWGGLIDLDAAFDAEAAARALFDELTQPSREQQIALREAQRLVGRLVRPQEQATTPALTWRTDASYLITGGLGDIGLQVARWMVAQGARHLILMGRTALPPRASWSEIPSEQRQHQVVATIRELEALGATIHLAAVDVADAAALAAFLATYRREGWPAIRGVVHAAGILMDRSVLQLEAEAIAEVMRPKIAGAWALHQLLGHTPLDFFVLFSALGALLGSPGLANYAAANAFLDALAHYRNLSGLPGMSINWGAWHGLGLATSAGAQRLAQRMAGHGLVPMPPATALDVLGHLLEAPLPAVAVAPIQWEQFVETRVPGERLFVEELVNAQAHADANATLSFRQVLEAAATHDEQATMLQTHVQEQVAKVLQVAAAQIELERPLGTMGFDSIMNLELRKRLEISLHLTLPATLMWNYPTVAAIAAYLAEQLGLTRASSRPALEQPEDLDEIADFHDLTDEQAEALLAARLASLDERI